MTRWDIHSMVDMVLANLGPGSVGTGRDLSCSPLL